jgi:catechol 2,3-dioxygenase-like lactoylglutathione lyase family enzyme
MTEQPIPFTGVNEITLEVPDLEKAERFYTEVLGMPVVERWTDAHPAKARVVAGDRTRIGLWEPMIGFGGAQGGVHVHYALHVPSEHLEAALDRIRSHGHEVTLQDHSRYGHGRGTTSYVTDPAGHVVELWEWDVAEHMAEYHRGESPGTL